MAKILAVLEARTKLLAFFFGLCFVTALLVLAICFPDPTAFQYTVFRIVLALAAAGVAGVIPGMIRLKVQPGTALLIHAGGALAVFVMVYLLAPAALKTEQAAPPSSTPPKEKSAALQPLKISGADAVENGVHVFDFTPPVTRHTARLSNISDTSVHISLVGFPEKYFYTNLADEKSLLQGHDDKDISVILMFAALTSKQKEYLFEIQDSAGGIARIAIRINAGWSEYLDRQRRKIITEDMQGASAAELYKSAKKIITESGYKQLTEPLQDMLAGQLLASADQPDAATLAYVNIENIAKIKVISAEKVSSVMWRAINGDIENDASNDALIGLLFAKQFLSMGNISTGASGELYIDGVAIKNSDDALIYIDQHAELISPVFIKTGGYDALNTALWEQAKAGNILMSKHIESRGLLHIDVNTKIEASTIELINKKRVDK